MKRGALLVVPLLVVGVAAASFTFRAAQRDRAELVASFGDEQLSRLHAAVREVEAELADVAQHLAFVARLVGSAESAAEQQRELEALLAVGRAYRMIAVYDGAARQHVVAVDPLAGPGWSPERYATDLADTARAAMARHDVVVSRPLGEPGAQWHRVFATPFVRGRSEGALVILVELRSALERLRAAALDPSAKLLLLGPDRRVDPLSDPSLALAWGDPGRNPELARTLERMREGQAGRVAIPAAEAARLGLAAENAVAAFAPIRAGAGGWAVAVVSPTATLRPQERAILARTGFLAAAALLAPVALSVILVASSRRAVAVRERLRIAEQVAHLREKAEKILENVPVGVVALDGEGRISALNRASRERVASSALGESVEAAFPDAPAHAIEALTGAIAAARRSGRVQSIVAEPLPLSGRDSYFAVHAVPLAHPLPDLEVFLVIEDVTELRALSFQLLRAEKLATVGVLAAGITHEVGTPLGVIRGRAEILVSKLGPGNPQAENAKIIVAEIDRTARLIQQLLDFSRLSRAVVESVPLEGVASHVAELLALEARTRHVGLAVSIAPDLPPLAANPDQLKQVLVNLTLNALHACSPGGHVTVQAAAALRARHASIEVVDDGAGIPEALRHRVFDPFFTTKKRGKGTGLGLTVAAQIVRNHGGEIDLTSAPGRGTRVVVKWPLASSGAEEGDGQGQRRAHPGGR